MITKALKAGRSRATAPPAPKYATPLPAVCLDLETRTPDHGVVEAAIRRWMPPPNMVDEGKIEVRRIEAARRIEERGALLDGAPIACIAVVGPLCVQVWNGLDGNLYELGEAEHQVAPCGNEKEMLTRFRTWLDVSTGPDTVLVGFNLIGFDLPKLRARYLHHRLRLPEILRPRPRDERPDAYDVMSQFLRWFTVDRRDDRFISLAEVQERLGLPGYKDAIDGSQIPGLIQRGRVREVLTYCLVDTLATWAAYTLMTSTAHEMT